MNWDKWPNFSEREFKCGCGCGRADMDPEFMDKLQAVRDAYGLPMTVSSGFRCEGHNHAVGGAPGSMHLKGRAADIAIAGADARDLLFNALPVMNGVGVKQRGPWNGRFLHLDDRELKAIWTY